MARRQDNSEQFIEALSRLPPYITLPAGFGMFVLCAYLGRMPIEVGQGDVAAGHAAALTIMRILAISCQYMFPIMAMGASVLWLIRWLERRRVERLADAIYQRDVLANMTWLEFEKVIAEGFRRHGFEPQLTAPGADGGVDIVLVREGLTFLVQAKHWKARSVGVETARALFGVMHSEGASGAYLVTSGQFTRAARAFAAGKSLWLYDGRKLRNLMAAGQAKRPALARTNS